MPKEKTPETETDLKPTVGEVDVSTKAQQLAEAAKRRNLVEQEANRSRKSGDNFDNRDEEAEQAKKEAGELLASQRPQAVAQSLAGIDPDAMGDVKGDGGDAKEYDDADPAKALGVPTYEHGLKEHSTDGSIEAGQRKVFGEKISERTRAEQERGRKAIEGRSASDTTERRASATRTVVTDADADPDGKSGTKEAEAKAKK